MIFTWSITLLRASLIALAIVFLAKVISSNINYLRGRKKALALSITLIPILIPPLVPAYAFSAFSLNFQTQPIPNEILYFSIMVSRLLPFAVLLLLLTPPPISQSSIICDQLSNQKNLSNLHKASHILITFLCVFLLAFNEYEIASLMRIKHWTVTLFNAHAGGLVLNLGGSFKMALFPAFTSLLAIIITFNFLRKKKHEGSTIGRKPKFSFFFILLVSSLISWIIPFFIILFNSFEGFHGALTGAWMRKELINSTLVTFISTFCCITFAAGIIRISKKSTMLFVLPGLFGALLLGLLFIYLFNLPILDNLKQTVLPLSLALILYGFPIAILMNLFLKQFHEGTSLTRELLPSHSQKLIKWETFYIPGFLLSLPVFCYIWFDLTISSMLAPASFTTVFPRIYNLMHYSENEKLSATLLIISFIPFFIYLLVYLSCLLTLKWKVSRSIK